MTTDRAQKHPDYPFPDVEEFDLGPVVDEFRAAPGLHQVQMPYDGSAYLVVRHDDVRRVLTEPVFSRELGNAEGVPRLQDEQLPVGSLSAFDGEDHLRLRRLIAATFTARRVRAYREETNRAARRFVTEMQASGAPADIVPAVCRAVPTHMICEILGIPDEDRPQFAGMLAGLRAWRRPKSHSTQARSEIELYFVDLIERRRHERGTDLLSELVTAHEERAALSEVELLNMAVALLGGGVGTPKVFFSGMVHLLLTHPESFDRIKKDPAQAAPVMEEMLRFIPVGTGGGKMRVAREDVELGGTLVRAGEALLPGMGAANRDPEVYPDPDTLDWDRGARGHLAFGAGSHRCLGAEFARLQGHSILHALADLAPDLRLDDAPDAVTWLDGDVTRGPASIMVRW